MSLTKDEQALLEQLQAHEAAIAQEEAKRHLVDFSLHTRAGYTAPQHIRFLADLLEQAERGKLPRLAISIAPGHGKSTLLQNFVAWYLGRGPARRILALSANEDLANRNSFDIRGLVQNENWPWPDIKLVGQSLTEWRTSKGGGVRAIGQTGVVTGFRAEMILCDDLQPDAGTEGTRQKLEDWFRGVMTTRLQPNGIVVLIQTRWHDDDLIGRLETGESRHLWKFVNIPALARDDNDAMGRKVGEALWPEVWPVEVLLERKREIYAGPFEAQYQGDPVPAEGGVFKAQWFEKRYEVAPKEFIVKVTALDSAWKEGPSTDFSVLATWGFDGKDFYLLAVERGRWELPETQRRLIQHWLDWSPNAVVVEEKQSGIAILQQIRANTGIPIIGFNPRGDKRSRAEAVTPICEAGKVILPKDAYWLPDWLHEHLRFDAAKHDDQVDTTSMALDYLTRFVVRQDATNYNRYANFMAR